MTPTTMLPGTAPEGSPVPRVVADGAMPPPWDFAGFEMRAARQRLRRRRRRRGVGAAALLIVVVASLANWSAWQPDSATLAIRDRAAASAPWQTEWRADQSWLALLPGEPAVVSVETRMAVAELEDRIAWIDDSLSASATRGDVLVRINALENERARLVDSLVRVRFAEQLAAASR